jgi:tetratricopeptide (TPR) repeat protein
MIRTIIGGIFIFLLLTGCAGKKIISSDKPHRKLTEKELFEYQYKFMEANRAKLIGELGRAANLFIECIKINPDSDASFYELSNIYFAYGEMDKALEASKKALSIDKSNKWYYFQLARLYQVNEQKGNAVSVYEELVKKFPQEVEYKITLAALYTDNSQNDKALEILTKVEAETGLTEIVSLTRHNVYITTGEFEKAFLEVQKLINHFPDELRYQGILAELYARLGMDKQAIETYQKILIADPDLGTAHFSIAEFYRNRGLFNEAFNHYAKAFKDEMVDYNDKMDVLTSFYNDEEVLKNYKVQIAQLVELFVSVSKDIPQARFVAADFFLKTENFDRAIIELKRLVDLVPDNYPVIEQLLIVLSFQSRIDEVVEVGKVAKMRFPDKILVSYFLGSALFQKELFDEAIDIFESSLSLEFPDSALKNSFLLMLGDAFHRVNNFEKSDFYFAEVLRNEPENIMALNNWAYYLSLREIDLVRAESMSRITIEKEPENSTYLDTYAWILFKMGKNDEALMYIEKAVLFNGSNSAEILDHYGDILQARGELEKAVEMWKKALEIESDRELVMKKIEENEK